MTNSTVGYIALLRQLASFCNGCVGDPCHDRSICIIAYMDLRGWGASTPPIYINYIYIVHKSYTLLDLAPLPQTKYLGTPII